MSAWIVILQLISGSKFAVVLQRNYCHRPARVNLLECQKNSGNVANARNWRDVNVAVMMMMMVVMMMMMMMVMLL